MNNRKFTVIIPTRERADTLYWSLKTCVEQNYENLEIVVSDNFSQDNTEEIVRSYKDKRIKYFNTQRRVSMTENWEFALSKATGDYVTIIGDDDGIMPNCFTHLNSILDEFDVPAITWNKAEYVWENENIPESNLLSFTMKKNSRRKSAFQELNKLLSDENSDELVTLPSVYNSFISNKILKEIACYSKNRFFYSMTPDAYSAIAVSFYIKEFIQTTISFSITGLSKNSNTMSLYKKADGGKEAIRYIAESGKEIHPDFTFCLSNTILMSEAAFQFKDNNSLGKNFNISVRKIVADAMKKSSAFGETEYYRIFQCCELLAKNHGLKDFFDEIALKYPKNISENNVSPVFGYIWDSDLMVIDGNDYNLHNIYDASVLYKKFFFDSPSISKIIGGKNAFRNYFRKYGLVNAVKKGLGRIQAGK